MEVDLSKLEAGQTVKFKCGGESVIKSVSFRYNTEYWLYMSGYSCVVRYEGRSGLCIQSPMLDIIEIIPKPFDWKDVKPGMAFFDKLDVYFYQSGSIIKEDDIYKWHHNGAKFQQKGNLGNTRWIAFCHLVRAPEHDIEVTS